MKKVKILLQILKWLVAIISSYVAGEHDFINSLFN